MGQFDPFVSDFEGNCEKIIELACEAVKLKCDILMLPELAICGYPPEDLLFRLDFLEESKRALLKIAKFTQEMNIILVVGYPEFTDKTYNSAAVIFDGKIQHSHRKIFLSEYSSFDEKRYFTPGKSVTTYKTHDLVFGIGICEDIWYSSSSIPGKLCSEGCELLLNINASPYYNGKEKFIEDSLSTIAIDNKVSIAYLNCVGGQDELVFDGQSFAVDTDGNILARASAFEEQLFIVDFILEESRRKSLNKYQEKEPNYPTKEELSTSIVNIPLSINKDKPHSENIITPILGEHETVWKALTTGLRDYVWKNGFKEVILGLSGGIDSAVVAAIASDAIGAENIDAVFMPTKFSTNESYENSEKIAKNLGIKYKVIKIEQLFKKYIEHLTPHFAGKPFDITEENIQARIRGNVLMALSNKFGYLVLAAGNKSESRVGYVTLYGDMVGGFAVLKDVSKTLVWELARWRNKKDNRDLIPQSVIERPPTAELKVNQLDTDALPPYHILDKILKLYVDDEMSLIDIAKETKLNSETIDKVFRMVNHSEFKHRQASPGILITSRSICKGYKMPITRK